MKDLSLTKLHFKIFFCFVLLSALLFFAPGCGGKKSEPAEAESDADSVDEDFDAVEEDTDETEKTEENEDDDLAENDDNDSDTESDNDQDFTDYEEDEPVQGICLEEPCKDVENATGKCLTKGESGDYVCVCKENHVWFPNKKTCEPVTSFKGLPCTGQIKCYDNEKEIPCPKAGEPFFGQDANYAENRSCLPQNFTIKHYGSDKTVIDNNSKLEWVQAVRVSYNYYTRGVGGYSDWRDTFFRDYNSIIDSGTFDPVINEAYFPDTPSGIFVIGKIYEYWDKTGPYSGNNYYGMEGIDFKTGFAKTYYSDRHTQIGDIPGNMPKQINYRSVRDLPDKQESCTVTLQSGEYELHNLLPQKLLMLMTPEDGKNWQEALEYCENLAYAGISDWRLPNRNELFSAIPYHLNRISGFWLWSSTTYTKNPTQAVSYTEFSTHHLSTADKISEKASANFCVAFDPCPEGEMWTGEKCASFDELGLESDGGGTPNKEIYERDDSNFECSMQIL